MKWFHKPIWPEGMAQSRALEETHFFQDLELHRQYRVGIGRLIRMGLYRSVYDLAQVDLAPLELDRLVEQYLESSGGPVKDVRALWSESRPGMVQEIPAIITAHNLRMSPQVAQLYRGFEALTAGVNWADMSAPIEADPLLILGAAQMIAIVRSWELRQQEKIVAAQ